MPGAILYKYLPPERVDVIEALKVRFTQPRAFNDPFECTPVFALRDQYEKLLEEHSVPLRKRYDDVMANSLISDDDKREATSMFEESMRKMRASFDQLDADGNPNLTHGLAESIDRSIGILSLALDPANLLMWSHYADCHRGFAVGMDSENVFFHLPDPLGRTTPIHEVEYARDRIKVVRPLTDDYKACLLTKAKEWAYEREVRVMRVLTGDYEIVGKDAEGHDVYLFNYPKEAIREVIFGIRCRDDCRTRVRAALARHGMESVRLRQAYQSHLSYEVEVRDVP